MNNENTQTTTAIATRNMTAIDICRHADSLERLGKLYAASGFFGSVTASTATAIVVNCFTEGLSPMEYKAKYHTMENGTPTIQSAFVQREFHRLGGDWEFNEWSAEVCDITFTYHKKSLRGRVTIDEFKANGVAMSGSKLKANWAKFPREMLKARCMTTYIRAICPEAACGLYTREELMDSPFNDAAQVTQAAQTQVAEVAKVDANVCPCGSVKGKAWTEISSEMLTQILETPAERAPQVTDAHREAIIAELGRRENAIEAEAQVVNG